MEIIEGRMCDSLQSNSEIYVHCIEMDEFISPPIQNLAAVRFNLAYGHVSFMASLEERRLLLFLATDDLDLPQVKQPCNTTCCIMSLCVMDMKYRYKIHHL